MKNIAFYISNHGFGHAARNIPIIQNILEQSNNVKIIIKSGKNQLSFVNQSLKQYSSRIDYYELDTDLGLILLNGSIVVDRETLKSELDNYINSWEHKISIEKKFLLEYKVDLVVSDITPWIFQATKDLNIKSLLLTNFTWCEIYNEYFDETISSTYLEYYKLVDNVLLYPLYNKALCEYFDNYSEIGLSVRRFNEDKVLEIKTKFSKPIIFISVGRSVGINTEINTEKYPYDFICTEGVNLVGNNVFKLPVSTLNTQDYINASNYVISKAGWSTVAETICAGKPMMLLSRNEVAEDRFTVNKIKELKIGIEVDSDFHSIFNNLDIYTKELDKLKKNFHRLDEKYNNSAEKISRLLLNIKE